MTTESEYDTWKKEAGRRLDARRAILYLTASYMNSYIRSGPLTWRRFARELRSIGLSEEAIADVRELTRVTTVVKRSKLQDRIVEVRAPWVVFRELISRP